MSDGRARWPWVQSPPLPPNLGKCLVLWAPLQLCNGIVSLIPQDCCAAGVITLHRAQSRCQWVLVPSVGSCVRWRNLKRWVGWGPSARRGPAAAGKSCDTSPTPTPHILPHSPALGEKPPSQPVPISPRCPGPIGNTRPRAPPPTPPPPYLGGQRAQIRTYSGDTEMRDPRQEAGVWELGKDDKAAPRVLQPDPVPTQATRPWPRPRAPRRCRHSHRKTSCPAAPRTAASSPTGPLTPALVTFPPSTPTPEEGPPARPPSTTEAACPPVCVPTLRAPSLSRQAEALGARGCRSAAPSAGRCAEVLAGSAACAGP